MTANNHDAPAKRPKGFLLMALISLLGLILAGCGTGKPELVKVDAGFSNYVSAYSSGMQSRTEPIRVQLQDVLNEDALASVKKEDTLLLQDIF